MHDDRRPGETGRRFGAGIEDAVLWPIAVVGVVAKTLLRWTWRLLVHIVDYAFPIFLQVARFLLFTVRILGDGVSALLRFVINYLPLPSMRRQAWREAVARTWSWIRRKISYKAFEEWVHHLFEDGMAWVFRTCRRLSPTGALLVILLALVWIPLSFTAATAVHAWLIAKAASLPSWMQVLHAVAAILAKSKLLMLPAYPAAWPQAKKHPIVEAGTRVVRFVANLHVVRKLVHRFGQADDAADRAGAALLRAAEAAGLVRVWRAVRGGVDGAAAWLGARLRAAGWFLATRLAKVPVLGFVLRSYASHYDRAERAPQPKLSQRIRAFFDRWEIKFTPAYYEAKDKEKAPESAAAPSAQPPAGHAPAP